MDKRLLLGLGIIVIVCFIFNLRWKDKSLLKETYSQIGQDINVINYFKHKENGYFIDIGATNGIDINNTYLLEKKYGWNGICIEPQSSYWSDLKKNRKCYVDNSMLYSDEGIECDFSEAGVLGGITKHIDKHIQSKKSNQVKMISNTLNNILNKYNAPTSIDYMSLDTEGSELEILKGLDFDKYKIKYINVEHNYIEPRRSEIRKLLESKGYIYHKENQWDDDYILLNNIN
jgi:FkbM family methyltransferase